MLMVRTLLWMMDLVFEALFLIGLVFRKGAIVIPSLKNYITGHFSACFYNSG